MDVEIISETPLSRVDIKTKLEEYKKKKVELNFRSNKVLEQITETTKLKKKEAEDLKKELEELDIARLKDKQIIKLIDILPKSSDSIKSLFAGDNITLKQEDVVKIEEVVKKYA